MWVRRSYPGFTLIEMGVVLIILGIVTGMALPLLTSARLYQKQLLLQKNQEAIVYALVAYLEKHRQLPAPAQLEEQEDRRGEADRKTCTRHGPCVGIVPFKTLGLSEKQVQTGDQQWIFYATQDALTRTHAIDSLPPASSSPIKTGPHIPSTGLMAKSFCDVEDKTLHVVDSQDRPVLRAAQSPYQLQDIWAIILFAREEFVHSLSKNGVFNKSLDGHMISITRNNLMAIYARSPCRGFDRKP